MTTSTRSSVRRLVAGIGIAVLATAATACGGDDGATPTASSSDSCTVPTEPAAMTGKAAIFDLADIAVPIEVSTDNGYLTIEARADQSIEDLSTEFVQMVTDAGFDVAGTDNETVEAEVFFSKGDVAAGQVRMHEEADCPDLVDVTISVLDDPAVLPTS